MTTLVHTTMPNLSRDNWRAPLQRHLVSQSVGPPSLLLISNPDVLPALEWFKPWSWEAPPSVVEFSPFCKNNDQRGLPVPQVQQGRGENIWSKGENMSKIIGFETITMVHWWKNEKAADQIRGFILWTRTISLFIKLWTLESIIRFLYFRCPDIYHSARHIVGRQ